MSEQSTESESVAGEIITAFALYPYPFQFQNEEEAKVWEPRIAFLGACFYEKSVYDSFFRNITQAEYEEKFTPWYFVLLEVDEPFIGYILPRLMCACVRSPERWIVDVTDVLYTLDCSTEYLKEALGDKYEEYIQRCPPPRLTFMTNLTEPQAQAIKNWLLCARELFPEDREQIDELLRQ